jgi:hypothetical protein
MTSRDLWAPPEKAPLHDRAMKWVETHPQAMAVFERLALEAARTGFKFGVKALAERVRWQFRIDRLEGDEYKVNNSYVSVVGRVLVARHPSLADFIEFRKRRDE